MERVGAMQNLSTAGKTRESEFVLCPIPKCHGGAGFLTHCIRRI